MKRALIIAAALLVLAAAGARAVEIKDVPPNHWAYESIQKLVEKGYIAIYDDKTFRGDQAVSRTVFAAALAKLIDDVESGRIKMSGSDAREVQRLSEEFASDMADYEARIAKLEKRIADIESGEVVVQTDVSKATVEFRDKYDELSAQNEQLRRDVDILEDELKTLSSELASESKKRKQAQTLLMIGVIGAIAVGAGN